MTTSILIIVISLILSAFFSGMEIAFVSSNKIHIEIEKKEEGLVSTLLERFTRKPSKFITTMLLGNNIALVIYGFAMGELLMNYIIPMPGFQGFIVHTVISTLVILITGEFLPKVFFQVYANDMLKFFAVPAYLFYLVFDIISTFIMWISDTILKLFFKTEGDEVQEAFTKVELGNYINEQMETVEDDEEMDTEVLIFKNALEFSEIKSREVMIPRTEIIAVNLSESPKNLIKKFTETGLSKILVYKESNDDIIGYIHSFELFKRPKSLKSIMLPVIYVPETMLAKDVLNALIKKRISIAVVIDEYGGTSGMMTVEDIVEELFGEIEDEHDSTALIEEELGDESYRFSGRSEIDYLNETYKLHLPKGDNFETLAGLIVHYTEDIPEQGGKVEIEDYLMTIIEVSNTKIELVQLEPLRKDQS